MDRGLRVESCLCAVDWAIEFFLGSPYGNATLCVRSRMIDNSRASADFDVQWFRQEPYYLSGEGPGARETPTYAHKALFISVKDYKGGRRKR